ncbi:MAG: 6-phosphogluconolactonase, partial [Lentisphaeria bacterium]
MNHTIFKCENLEALAAEAAGHIRRLVRKAVADRGKSTLVLAGGHTPAPVYRRLGEGGTVDQDFWQHVYFLWGDERCVPPDDWDSNYRMAEENLFRHLLVPGGNVYRMPGELSPATAAHRYEEQMQELLLPDRDYSRKLWPVPQLDVVLLGLGEDGHTASLFP